MSEIIEGIEVVRSLYCDGGVIKKNPSPFGGTWAWCGVDENGTRIIRRGGFVPAYGRLVTNNITEYIAATLALEAMPNGWSGKLYSDSQITLGRLFWRWRNKNLPANVYSRGMAAVERLGKVEPVLLQGHPTKADLARGIGKKRGYPVSIHNVWCDEECGRQARLFLESQIKSSLTIRDAERLATDPNVSNRAVVST